MSSPETRLREYLEGTSGKLLIVTGAGVSVASEIPTFRGPEPDAVWSADTTRARGAGSWSG